MNFNPRWFCLALICSFLSCLPENSVLAKDRVDIVVGQKLTALDQFAAEELETQLERLFDIEAKISKQLPQDSTQAILLGNSQANIKLATQAKVDWPELTDQGLVLRSFKNDNVSGLIVDGGSPVATLWAVYELGHHFGIRYLISGDIVPEKSETLSLADIDIVQEPELKVRTWRTVNDFALGFESWGLVDQQKLISQLAKLKFNNLMISVYPWQPFVHYEFGGVKKQTGVLWFGDKYRVDGDTPGRQALGRATWFENPDFIGKETYEQRTAAGQKLIRGIIDAAHDFGMTAGISISPLEFPKEFAKALPGANTSRGLNNLLIAPSAKQKFDDKQLLKLVKTKVRAYLDTYPDLDELYLTMPEFPEWSEHAQAAWNSFHKKGEKPQSLESIIAVAEKRDLIATGERGQQSVKGNLVALAFLNKLLKDADLLKTSSGRNVTPFITAVDPALFPVLEKVIPANTGVLHFIDYTARRVAKNKQLLKQVPANNVPSRLIITLADDNVGVLNQSALTDIETLMAELRSLKWDGFSTRHWLIGDLDPTISYLGRASFDENLTAKASFQDFFNGITDNPAATDRIWLGYEAVEKATQIIDDNDLGFAFPVKNMLLKHAVAKPIPEWWQTATDEYTKDLVELYRSYDAITGRSRPLFYYYAKRSEFMLSYMSAVKAVRESAIAKKAGDIDKQIEQLETALEAMYNGLDTLGDIARDQSDRGLIAVLNAYAYQPLLEEYEKVLDESEK